MTPTSTPVRDARSVLRSLERLSRFTWVMAPPHLLLAYGALWTLALEGSAALLSSTTGGWDLSWGTAARVVTVVCTLVFLRMVDEQKDLAYDRVHHPDRPLVTGAITARELRTAMAFIAVGVVALNALLSAASVALIVAALGYGLALYGIERLSPAIRDGLIANLFVTYPVQLILSLYLYYSLASTDAIAPDWRVIALAGIFAGAFLHFEFARKTAWIADAGERLYSSAIGPYASGAICLGLALGAVACELAAFQPWRAPALALALLAPAMVVLPLAGAQRFFLRHANAWPVAPAMLFILGTYAALIAQATQAL